MSIVGGHLVRGVPEEQMTRRARAYLIISATMHLSLGLACTIRPDDFDGDGFAVIRDLLPVWTWGVVHLVGGLHLAYASIRATERHARLAMSMSAVLTSLWAASFALSYTEGGVVSPAGALLACALTAKDLVICAQPMRSPFEPLMQEYAGDPGAGTPPGR